MFASSPVLARRISNPREIFAFCGDIFTTERQTTYYAELSLLSCRVLVDVSLSSVCDVQSESKSNVVS